MEFRQLQTFIQAAQLQSFSRAAVQLGYSQSAVTVQIRILEKVRSCRVLCWITSTDTLKNRA